MRWGVDIREAAVSAILDEQVLWRKQKERRNQSEYYQKRNLLKLRANKRHAAEKDHMVTLRAVGCTTAEYVGSSGTADTIVMNQTMRSQLKLTLMQLVVIVIHLQMAMTVNHSPTCYLCSSSMTVSQLAEVHMMTT